MFAHVSYVKQMLDDKAVSIACLVQWTIATLVDSTTPLVPAYTAFGTKVTVRFGRILTDRLHSVF